MTYPKAGTPASPALRRAWPKPPAWETWIVSIGVAVCHAPTRSRINRLAYDSAIGRNEVVKEVLSKTATRSPGPSRAKASVQPTGPAPWMRTSVSGAGIAHQRLDVIDALGRFGGNHFAAALGDEDVVLDADADVVQRLWHIVGGTDVETGLDRQHHARREAAPLSRALVIAGIVHVEAQPVSGAVHIEALVGFLLKDLVERPGRVACIARRCAPAAMRAARRITDSSCASLSRRMSSISPRTSCTRSGAATPARARARTVFSQFIARASQCASAPRGVNSAGWSSSSRASASSSLPIGCASPKPQRPRR